MSIANSTASTVNTAPLPQQIIEKLDFPLFKPDWLAIEEVLLLDAIATSGLGNWEAAVCHQKNISVATHSITHMHKHPPTQAQNLGSKTADECRDHYYEVYFGSKCAPLPDPLDIIPGSPHTLQEMHAQAIASKPRLHPSLFPLRSEAAAARMWWSSSSSHRQTKREGEGDDADHH